MQALSLETSHKRECLKNELQSNLHKKLDLYSKIKFVSEAKFLADGGRLSGPPARRTSVPTRSAGAAAETESSSATNRWAYRVSKVHQALNA
jgi:hypothetical protein